jgi:hypothetical protein
VDLLIFDVVLIIVAVDLTLLHGSIVISGNNMLFYSSVFKDDTGIKISLY